MVIASHLLCVAIFIVLPEVLMSMGLPYRVMHPLGYAKAAMFIVVFYTNYLFLARNLAAHHRTWRFILCNLLLLAAFAGINMAICKGFSPPHHLRVPAGGTSGWPAARLLGMLLRDSVMYVLTIALAVAMRLHEQWLNAERINSEMITLSRQDELRSLKSQINPHFLFNSLNTIYALIDISPEKARGAVHELSGLLRYVLYENPSTVTLRQEVAFVDNYLMLAALRLDPKVKLEITLDTGDSSECRIAPLLFVTVIENIFKHGDTSPGTSGTIKVSITAQNGHVSCLTSNRPALRSTHEKGIGLANLRRRLELIYGNNATLSAGLDSDGQFVTRMDVSLPHPPAIQSTQQAENASYTNTYAN